MFATSFRSNEDAIKVDIGITDKINEAHFLLKAGMYVNILMARIIFVSIELQVSYNVNPR